MTTRIKIGISSCLLGNNVRYDGGNKLDRYLIDTLGGPVEWVPVCPEVECGLSVPREPMHLVNGPDFVRLITIETNIDHTERMNRWMVEKLAELEKENLCGFVFKARSPSCGVSDAEIAAPDKRIIGKGPGLFAAACMLRFPSLPIEDEETLRNPAFRERFLFQIHACGR